MPKNFLGGMVGANSVADQLQKSLEARETPKNVMEDITKEISSDDDIPVLMEHPLNEQIAICAKLLLEHVYNPEKIQVLDFWGKVKVRIDCRRQKKIIKEISFQYLCKDKEGEKWVEIARTPWAAACFIIGLVRGLDKI